MSSGNHTCNNGKVWLLLLLSDQWGNRDNLKAWWMQYYPDQLGRWNIPKKWVAGKNCKGPSHWKSQALICEWNLMGSVFVPAPPPWSSVLGDILPSVFPLPFIFPKLMHTQVMVSTDGSFPGHILLRCPGGLTQVILAPPKIHIPSQNDSSIGEAKMAPF